MHRNISNLTVASQEDRLPVKAKAVLVQHEVQFNVLNKTLFTAESRGKWFHVVVCCTVAMVSLSLCADLQPGNYRLYSAPQREFSQDS